MLNRLSCKGSDFSYIDRIISMVAKERREENYENYKREEEFNQQQIATKTIVNNINIVNNNYNNLLPLITFVK